MKIMNVLIALVCTFSVAAVQAREVKVSPARMSCADFTVVDEAYQPALVYWVAGVDKLGVRETDTFVVDTAHPVSETVVEECKNDPQAPFMSKVRSLIIAKKVSLLEHH
ncbi:HdeA/HdeB family chaperone [Paraburkholderia humisilvae]|uniref:Acid stress chaperone HdeA n=1 Tax=Paraburkholderia humisilvae TaxID=627669 RepID=A0A6J5F8A6_9BURK|nr:HdeA/HdeB family chaperone [Paraburkholderia humisilvae]CAB3774011.1 Acid stress chaperone HdeA [Paraburkholderia humisilvae]